MILVDLLGASAFQKHSLQKALEKEIYKFALIYLFWVFIGSLGVRMLWIYAIKEPGLVFRLDEYSLLIIFKPVLSTAAMDCFLILFALVAKLIFLPSFSSGLIIRTYISSRMIIPLLVLFSLLFHSFAVPLMGFLYFGVFWIWAIGYATKLPNKQVVAYVTVCLIALIIAFAFIPYIF